MTQNKHKQPWIKNVRFDTAFILVPPFLSLLIVLLLPAHLRDGDQIPLAGWVFLVLFIDVAHVYSTLYKTYWNREYFNKQRNLFIWTPVICYVAGVILYSIDGLLFWRILAYIAVFHFIRQQYGFMRLYARYEPKKVFTSKIDTLAIYAATLYPIIYWHCTPGRNFSWFVEGDFISLGSTVIKQLALIVYAVIMMSYVVKEITGVIKARHINLPKNAVVIGTAVSWYFGIVYFNGDLVFTLLNVVSHGIPYIALIWLGKRTVAEMEKPKPARAVLLSRNNLVFFIGSLLLLAYVEEGLWDGLVWREHSSIFVGFTSLPKIENAEMLAVLVPLLTLPQFTHYVLDGFIWRRESNKE